MAYDLKSVKAPRLAGLGLRIFANLIEWGFPGKLIIPQLLRDAGVTAFRRKASNEVPTLKPLVEVSVRTSGAASKAELKRIGALKAKPVGFRFPTASDYVSAYKKGRTNPEDVARAVSSAIRLSNDEALPLRAIIQHDPDDLLAQGRASAARWRRGKPLGPLDGVPISIKDELDQLGYRTTVGTRFLGTQPAIADATPVRMLREAGALLIGKANMHEIGIGVTGLNPHHGAARNPYHTDYLTGGSSSGSGGSVAAGLCSISIGADGGGSIRIPAAFCGVYGIKATFGRVSETGAAPLCWSVAHVGPLAGTARDLALGYAAVAGPDPLDPTSLAQPPLSFAHVNKKDLKGLRLGVYEPWFKHASAPIVTACEDMLGRLKKRGARVVSIELPHLEEIRVSHVITISSEMAHSFDDRYPTGRRAFGHDVRVNLALARSFTSRDYIHAQRVRTRAMENFARALERCDAIMTPTTGVVAPLLKPDAGSVGETDLTTLTEIMRFVVAANFTGNPAVSFPVGYDSAGLPIGMQAMGRHWEEDLLLRIAMISEQELHRRAPNSFFDIIK